MKNKYKERNPKDTIRIISHFFNSLEGPDEKRFNLIKADSGNDSGFWWHKYELYYEDLLILTSYGKGETEEYSKASAYAEMYERFAWYNNLLVNEDKKLLPDEVPINAALLAKPFPQVSESQADTWYAVLLNKFGKVAGVPFKGIWGGEMLIDLNAKAEADGSNGIAAGNTLKEALNQGLSELIERYVQNICYHGGLELKRIDDTVIKKEAPDIYRKIQILADDQIDIKIYDASFSTGLPVLCSVVIDKKTLHHRQCFGAFPVFNIALERTLTEIFQGQTYDRHDFIPCGQHEEHVNLDAIRNNRIAYPRKQFIKAETTDEVGSFIKAESNDEIFEYLKDLFKREGFDAYYYDLSLCEDMKAVYIHSPQLEEHVSFDTFCDGQVVDRTEKIISLCDEGDITRADLKKFIKIFEDLTITESRSLFELFFRSPIAYVQTDYLMGVCNTLLYRYQHANECLAQVPHNEEFEALSYLKLYAKLRSVDATNKTIKEELKFWGAPDDLLKAFMNMDVEKLIEIYLFDIVRSLRKVRTDLSEVRKVIRRHDKK